jgi:hypothetical protein
MAEYAISKEPTGERDGYPVWDLLAGDLTVGLIVQTRRGYRGQLLPGSGAGCYETHVMTFKQQAADELIDVLKIRATWKGST